MKTNYLAIPKPWMMEIAKEISLMLQRLGEGCYEKDILRVIQSHVPSSIMSTLKQIAEIEGDCNNQNFKLTRFQCAQIARAALLQIAGYPRKKFLKVLPLQVKRVRKGFRKGRGGSKR